MDQDHRKTTTVAYSSLVNFNRIIGIPNSYLFREQSHMKKLISGTFRKKIKQ